MRWRVSIPWLVWTLVGAVVVSVGVAVWASQSDGWSASRSKTAQVQIVELAGMGPVFQLVRARTFWWTSMNMGVAEDIERVNERWVEASKAGRVPWDTEVQSPRLLVPADSVDILTGGDSVIPLSDVRYWSSGRFGAPFRCLWWSYGNGHDSVDYYEARYRQIKIAGFSGFIPVGVLWPGMIGNVVIYWAVLLGLGELVRWTRRRLRIRHGRCAACAYSRVGLGAGLACPECGKLPA